MNYKIWILMMGWLGIGLKLSAQEIHTPVIISNGGYDESSTISLDWTFGEVFADYENVNSISLTQGFYHASCFELEFSLEAMNASCFEQADGLIMVNSENLSRLQYHLLELDSMQFGTQALFTRLPAGEYTVRIADIDSCTVTEQKMIIDEPDEVIVNIAQEEYVIRSGGSVEIEASGADSYTWTSVIDTNNVALDTGNIFNIAPLETITYQVTGTVDECTATAQTTVKVVDFMSLKPRLIISPNNDGINDVWIIDNIDLFPDAEIVIVNRWQQEVFRKKNYQNNWDGRFKGQILPEGAYYYVITLSGTKNVLAGDVNLLR